MLSKIILCLILNNNNNICFTQGNDVIIPQALDIFLQGLVFAGIADLARPADKLSPSQSTALAATGRADVC